MLDLTVKRTVTRPSYQVFTARVQVGAYNRLTPTAARHALRIAFGQPYGGEVWDYESGVGYRVYPRSARKLYDPDAPERLGRKQADWVEAERELAQSIERVCFLTADEAATRKGCHPEAVRRAAHAGAFPRARRVGITWLLPAPEVDAWCPGSPTE